VWLLSLPKNHILHQCLTSHPEADVIMNLSETNLSTSSCEHLHFEANEKLSLQGEPSLKPKVQAVQSIWKFLAYRHNTNVLNVAYSLIMVFIT
jgi:hypothetical protein